MGASSDDASAPAAKTPAIDPDFDLGEAPASAPAAPVEASPADEAALEPAASAQKDIPTVAAPIRQPEPSAFEAEPEAAPPEVASEPARKSSAAVSSAAATIEPGDDVLGLPADLGAGSVNAAEDEDVLGVAPREPVSQQEPDPVAPIEAAQDPNIGTTLKLERDDLASLIEKESGSETPGSPRASAQASMTQVGADDALFNEPGVEATRLAPGQPQEILIPVEIDQDGSTRRFRLTLFLELDA
jgi:hypothetical protein